jgi:hypothetical protein
MSDAKALAQEVCAGLELSEAATKLLKPGLTAGEFFDALVRANLLTDAIPYTARLLPKKAAVWWGCLCVWNVARPAPSAKIEAALQSVVKWLRDPSEENRRACDAAAKTVGNNQAAGMLATAAFLSEGSMSLPGQPVVKPEPHFTAKLVGQAVLAASREGRASQMEPRQRQFLATAVEVYRGKNLPT